MNDTSQIEQLKRWEQGLSREQIEKAFDFVRANGWGPGTTPPPFVWQAAYLHVDPQMVGLSENRVSK